jgi:magnesium-transporting ATPase (P-type)
MYIHFYTPLNLKNLLFSFESFMANARAMSSTDAMYHSFATCHSLARLLKKHVAPGEPDSEIIGDPLEIKMFDMTGWHLLEPRVGSASKAALASILETHTVLVPTNPGHQDIPASELAAPPMTAHIPLVPGDHNASCFAMIRQFTFSSALQRMAVIIGATNGRDYKGPLYLYAKVLCFAIRNCVK